MRITLAELIVPPAVFRELVTDGTGWLDARMAQDDLLRGEWMRVVQLRDRVLATKLASRIGEGESEAIALASEFSADVLLDDRLARRAAESLGIRPIGTLGVLERAKLAGAIPKVAPLVRQMRLKGIRFSDKLVNQFLCDMEES